MSPHAYGIRVGLLAWFALLASAIASTAISAVLLARVDPISAVVWGLYVGVVAVVPTLGIGLLVGAATWASARRTSSTQVASKTPSRSATAVPPPG